MCGVLAAVTHGCSVVLTSEIFEAEATIKAIEEEGCSVLHAVPVMFQAILRQLRAPDYINKTRLRTGIVAGASFSQELVDALHNDLQLTDLRYGFGEALTSGDFLR